MTSNTVQPMASDPPAASDERVLLPAIAKLGIPVMIFGLVFGVIAVLLTHLVSPDRFPVRIGDKSVRLTDLQAEEHELNTKKAKLLTQREKLLEDGKTSVLRSVEVLRASSLPIGSVLLAADGVRRSFKIGAIDPISLPRVSFDASTRTLTLAGEVRDANGRSIQILASFVDGLRDIALVRSVSEPEYLAEADPAGGTRSPFVLTVIFADAS